MRILISGSRSQEYPETGVRLAFDFVRAIITPELAPGEPVVVDHGDASTGVDYLAKNVSHEYGWEEDPHPARWAQCTPLCPQDEGKHRRKRYVDSDYCPLAGPWRNKRMVDQHVILPYRLGVFLPWQSWSTSKGTRDCYDRALAAGIECHALGPDGHAFVDTKPAMKRG